MIELETLDRIDVYRVSEIVIVKPDDVSVLRPTAGPTLSLVTCYPFYFIGSAPERYIVVASLLDSGNPEINLDHPKNTTPVSFKPANKISPAQSQELTKETTQ
jgi:sortase A